MDTLKYGMHASRMLLKSHLQYFSSFFWHTISMAVMTGGELGAVLLLFGRFHSLGQWSGGEIFLFFGMMQFAFSLVECFGRGISSFGSMVQSGGFDTVLLRPRNAFVQVLFGQMDPRRLGSALVGLTAIIMATRLTGLVWTLSKLLCLLLALMGTFALFLGLFLIEAVLCIFSVKSIEIVNILTYGGRTACQYPIDIYPRPMRALFLYVAPIGLTLHLPAAYILEKSLLGEAHWMAFISPMAGFIVLAVMLLVWRIGVKKYRSTGS